MNWGRGERQGTMNGHSRSNKHVRLAQPAMAVCGIIDCFDNISVGVPAAECFDHFAVLYHHKVGQLLCGNINLVRVVRLERIISWYQRKFQNFFPLLNSLFPHVPHLAVVINVVKNASRLKASDVSPAPGGKRFCSRVIRSRTVVRRRPSPSIYPGAVDCHKIFCGTSSRSNGFCPLQSVLLPPAPMRGHMLHRQSGEEVLPSDG